MTVSSHPGKRQRLVVVGDGVAAARVLEELFARDAGAFDVTVFDAEPRVNHDRIMPSPVLAGEKAFEDIVIHDDATATRDPEIYAVGECVEHRGQSHGLVAPLFEMGKVLSARLRGDAVAAYGDSVVSTKPKDSGVDPFSAGDFSQGDDGDEILPRDPSRGVYKRIVPRDNRVKGARLNLAPWPASWSGFALTLTKPADIDAEYWALARTSFGWRLELASARLPEDFEDYARRLFGVDRGDGVEIIRVEDRRKGVFRLLALRKGRALGLLLVSQEPVEAARDHLCENFASEDPRTLRRLFAARPAAGGRDIRTICARHNVGAHEIDAAISAGASRVTEVGRATRAGTGRNSCRLEIQRLVKENSPVSAPLPELETA